MRILSTTAVLLREIIAPNAMASRTPSPKENDAIAPASNVNTT